MNHPPESSLADQWRDRLERFQRSGQTVAQFCADENYSTGSFYQWRRRINNEQPSAPGSFIPVQINNSLLGQIAPNATVENSVRIELPGGVVVTLNADVTDELLRRSLAIVVDLNSANKSGGQV